MSTLLHVFEPDPSGDSEGYALDGVDRWLAFGLVLVVLGYAVFVCWFNAHPQEDAAILLRYAQHLADGEGIVWNVGGRPVDGATDFLFMVVVAGLSHTGIGVEESARVLGFLAHLTVVFLIFFAARSLWRVPRPLAVLGAIFIGLGPGLRYVEAGFGTTFFALWVFLSWYWAARMLARRGSPRTPWAFSGSCLLMGLTRPEGVLVALLFFCTVIIFGSREVRSRVAVVFLAVFSVVGGAYFIWHWQYFGQPLPNPYYKKGGGRLYPLSLVLSLRFTASMAFPFLFGLFMPVAACSCRLGRLTGKRAKAVVTALGMALLVLAVLGLLRSSSETNQVLLFDRYSIRYMGFVLFVALSGLLLIAAGRSGALGRLFSQGQVFDDGSASQLNAARSVWWLSAAALPIVGFVLMWILISRQMNILGRFQYPIVPVIVVISLPLFHWGAKWIGESRGVVFQSREATLGGVVLVLIAAVFLGVWQHSRYRSKDRWPYTPQDGKHEVAQVLRDYAAYGYTLATSEAGLLPFYSKWRTLDAWGLNDPSIAKRGLIESDLAAAHPEVIMFHAYFSPLTHPRRVRGQWFDMVMTLKEYAEQNGYILAAVYGDSVNDAHYYYVGSECRHSSEIVERIRGVTYVYDRTGREAVDLAIPLTEAQ